MKSRSLFAFYLSELKNNKVKLCILMLCPLIWSICEVLAPYIIKLIIDDYNPQSLNGSIRSFWGYILLYLLILILIEGAIRLCAFIWISLVPKLRAHYRETAAQKIASYPLDYFNMHINSELIVHLKNLSQNFDQLFSELLFSLLPTLLTALILFFLLTLIDIDFPLFFMMWFFVMNLITLGFWKKSLRISKNQSESEMAFYGDLGDLFKNIISYKLAAHRESVWAQNLTFLSQKEKTVYSQREKLNFKIDSFRSLATLLMFLGMVFLFYYKWNGGLVTLGDLAFITAACFYTRRSMWVASLSLLNVLKLLGSAQNSFAQLNLGKNFSSDPTDKIIPKSHSISIKNVSFGYQKEHQVLENFSLDINPGEKILVTGPSGSGKTTLVNLILNLLKGKTGSIKIGGYDVEKVNISKIISYIPQKMPLFHSTIKENILFGAEGVTKSNMIKAAQIACAHDFIGSKKGGYKAEVGEGGILLSGGQQQRLAIARAFLKEVPIVMMDEALSALEGSLERTILKNWIQHKKDQTLIYISHSLENKDLYDRTILMK